MNNLLTKIDYISKYLLNYWFLITTCFYSQMQWNRKSMNHKVHLWINEELSIVID